MKKLFFIFILSISYTVAYSQTDAPKYNIPDEYSFVLPEDYIAYEQQIKDAIDWYLWRSMAFDSDKRQTAGEFFLKWLVGTPSVTVEIDEKIVNFSANNPELILPFAMGWTKYSIENTDPKDRVKACVSGIEAAVNYYNMNKGFLRKDENIEKYEEMIKKNKLEKYVKKNIPPKDSL